MDILRISFGAVAPLCLLISLGYLLRSKNLIDENAAEQLNRVTFRVFIPVLLFNNIYKTDIREVVQIDLIIYTVLSIFAAWVLSFIIAALTEKDPATRGAMIQGMYRSNFTLYGLPIVIFLFGDSRVGITSFMVALVVPIVNILAIITFELCRGGKTSFRRVIVGCFKNPIMIGSLFGIAALLLKIRFPEFLDTSIKTVASLAVPMSLLVMGARFNLKATKRKQWKLLLTVTVKLIVLPAIFLPIAIKLGFRNVELATLMAFFASPTAIVSYPMAVQMDSDGEFACNNVIFTTIISCVTVFLCICVLQYYSFIQVI